MEVPAKPLAGGRTVENLLASAKLESEIAGLESEKEKQEYLPESSQNFYSTTSSDECTFQPAVGPAQSLIAHIDGKDIEFKRLP